MNDFDKCQQHSKQLTAETRSGKEKEWGRFSQFFDPEKRGINSTFQKEEVLHD